MNIQILPGKYYNDKTFVDIKQDEYHYDKNEFIDCAFVYQNGIGGGGQVLVEDGHQIFWRNFFTVGGESANVGEQSRNWHAGTTH